MRERLSSSSSENPRVDECVGLKIGQTLQGSIGQTLQGSFSAVSKPNFASKYGFEKLSPRFTQCMSIEPCKVCEWMRVCGIESVNAFEKKFGSALMTQVGKMQVDHEVAKLAEIQKRRIRLQADVSRARPQ